MRPHDYEVLLQEIDSQRFQGPHPVTGSLRTVIDKITYVFKRSPHVRATICDLRGHIVRELATDVYGRWHFE